MTLQTQGIQSKLSVPTGNGRPATLADMLRSENVRSRFQEVLGERAPAYITSVLSTVNTSANLQKCRPDSIIAAAMIAAALNLPVDPNLGFAYIVAYGNQAQLQLGWKGFVQLAMRSSQYKTINVCEVYEGEIKNHNRFTGEFEFGEKTGDAVVGYCAYFKLLNGYEKYLYMPEPEIRAHAKQYSKTYSKGGVWSTNFHAMAMKTVLKRLLSKFGILSIDMNMGLALKADQAAIREVGEGDYAFDYPDGGQDEDDVIDVTAEVIEPGGENQ